jgi:peptidoglycan-associated lipoprotein
MFALRGTAGALIVAGLLAGCASSVPLSDNKAPVETHTATPVDPNANANGASQSQVTPVDLGKGNAAQDNTPRVVYFDFDSFVVRDDGRPVIEANAKRLRADPKKHVAIEGHTDERGGSEYNLALGQKRAEAVAKALQTLGVAESQMEATSFGKERPADPGHDEAAWAKNRRAELKDR